jgi:hypothetical protein
MSRRSIRPTVAGLAVAVTLVAGACGVERGDDVSAVRAEGGDATTSTVVLRPDSFEGTGGAVFLKEAARATGEVNSQKVSMTMKMAGVPLLGDIDMTVDGAFDNTTGQGTMELDLGDFLGGFMGGGKDAGHIEMILDGKTVYMKSPLFSELSGSDKEWLKADAADLEDGSGGGLAPGMSGDPAKFLDFLKGASDGLDEVGREDVRGVSTTHLHAELDIAKLMEDASPADRTDLEESLGSLGADGTFDSIPADAWVDDQGYVRRFELVFDFSKLADGGTGSGSKMELAGVTMTMTIELYDFNEPVEVQVPDAADVGELDPSVLSGGN